MDKPKADPVAAVISVSGGNLTNNADPTPALTTSKMGSVSFSMSTSLPTSEMVLVGPLTVCWNDFNDRSIVSFLCVWLNASPT